MRFCWSTLNVKDLEESIKFYTDVIGLEVVSKFNAGPEVEIAFLGKGETKIELICDGESRDTVIGNDISWGFEVESLDKALVLVKEKDITVDSGPTQPNPHVRYFFIKDPNGMRIQLVENIT
ncbi:VOC family protein [Clostridium estertheticum]|uniref:VOC family protein n=1 Tax=Clostridium estertheticum TaxID=238834 RepID=UPI001CF44C70|nr:VOC family protein [Clostridium estertheticum]MCB2354593.1 VOC family protein [Clostridium estertheticum]MCB2358519.1 VOC family protein [Clostridium estertheticum]WAG40841.1 VOC family protein [Clostridium estertheticum]